MFASPTYGFEIESAELSVEIRASKDRGRVHLDFDVCDYDEETSLSSTVMLDEPPRHPSAPPQRSRVRRWLLALLVTLFSPIIFGTDADRAGEESS